MNSIIVIPCFNESQRLPVDTFQKFLREQNSVQFVFVDDGSKDNTFQIIEFLFKRHPKKIDILRLTRNRGKAEAVRQGFLLALSKRPYLVGFWDADLATPLTEFHGLFQFFLNIQE